VFCCSVLHFFRVIRSKGMRFQASIYPAETTKNPGTAHMSGGQKLAAAIPGTQVNFVSLSQFVRRGTTCAN